MHTAITTSNIEEPQQKFRIGTVIYRFLWCVCVWGGGGGGGGGGGRT